MKEIKRFRTYYDIVVKMLKNWSNYPFRWYIYIMMMAVNWNIAAKANWIPNMRQTYRHKRLRKSIEVYDMKIYSRCIDAK